MKKVTDPEFRKYGRVLDIKIPDLLERLGKTPVTEGVVYVASEPELEACPFRSVTATDITIR